MISELKKSGALMGELRLLAIILLGIIGRFKWVQRMEAQGIPEVRVA